MPDGLANLRQLGVSLGATQAVPFRGIRFVSNNGEIEAEFSHGVGYGIRRTILHQLLVNRASALGVSLQWGARITGLSSTGVCINGQNVRYRWLICADGQNSRLRRAAALDRSGPERRRFGFRRHYKVAPWSDHVEVHWSDCGQMYVTPVSDNEICVALITRHPHLRFDEAFGYFPLLASRLRGIVPERDYLGALTTTRKFAAVHKRNIALIGEASGSVDAVTGEGLSMAFRQAIVLADALRGGDLRQYEAAHRGIARMPRVMSSLMLAMDSHPAFRRRVFNALTAEPASFGKMLAVHTGSLSAGDFGVRRGLTLGWRLLAV